MKKILLSLVLTGCLLPVAACTARPLHTELSPDGYFFTDCPGYSQMTEEEKAEHIKKLGLHFSDEEIEAAAAVAQQYYVDLSQYFLDPKRLYPEEIEELEERNSFLKQGVEITYDEQYALREIVGSNREVDIVQNDAVGTVMILSVTVPAAPETSVWHKRSIELNRDNINSEWYAKKGGEGGIY